jgi:predicted GIY-YIG superfamily endonuclease
MSLRYRLFRFEGSRYPTGTASGAPLIRVRSKTGLAASSRTGVVHRTVEVVAVMDGDRMVYAAAWLCGEGAALVRIVSEAAASAAQRCAFCEDMMLGYAMYRYFDADGALLYVGSTDDLVARRRAHQKRSVWWPLVDREAVERFDEMVEAQSAEVAAIRTEHPRYNKRHRALPTVEDQLTRRALPVLA